MTEYAREEWERMGIHLAATDADPLNVEPIEWHTLEADRVSVVGFALLVLAFAAGVAVGWALA